MKKIISIPFFMFWFFIAFAQNFQRPSMEQESMKMMQTALFAFDQKDYGSAVRYAEIAKKNRKAEVSWSMHVLNQALRPEEVRRRGDNLSEVIQILQQRDSIDALQILSGFFLRTSIEDLQNSVEQLLKRLESSMVFPEADFLLGKVYIFEGEYQIAEKYLTTAWQSAALLDIPDEKLDILYELAYLFQLKNDFDSYEKTLLLIISEDNLFSPEGKPSSFISAMQQSILRGISVDKFFSLYRHGSQKSLKAYYQLAEYYYESGNFSLALSQAGMASIIAFTRLFEVVQDRNNEFVYTDFSAFLAELTLHPDVVLWTSEKEIWKGFYFFSQILQKMEKDAMAQELLVYLGKSCPEEYWRTVAVRNIINKL